MILVILLVVVAVFYVSIYNGLVKLRQKVKEAWSGIDVQLKRRYDLIPNLVNTVQGYAGHEKETFEKVVQARSDAIAVPDGKIADQAKAESVLTNTLKSIFALSENYPDLKANASFMQLQEELSETEDQIASARRIYNANVTAMNIKVESFPSNFVAKNHGFTKEEFFEADEGEEIKKVPEVKF